MEKKYIIQDRETGTFIDGFNSYAEYDDTLGLRVNANPPIDDEDSQSFDEDFELD